MGVGLYNHMQDYGDKIRYRTTKNVR